jgi:SAM-dependent methyltransferase
VSTDAGDRTESYGQRALSAVDRLGAWLSHREVRRHLPKKSALAALDLGCGYHATLLRSLGPAIGSGTGIDVAVSPEARQESRLRFIEAPVEQALPTLESERFDLILLVSVLEHLREPLAVLEHCQRLLTRGGVLLVNVPTWRGKVFLELSAFRLGLSPALEMDDHKMYYDQRSLWPLLVRAGFSPSRVKLRTHKLGLNLFARASKQE